MAAGNVEIPASPSAGSGRRAGRGARYPTTDHQPGTNEIKPARGPAFEQCACRPRSSNRHTKAARSTRPVSSRPPSSGCGRDPGLGGVVADPRSWRDAPAESTTRSGCSSASDPSGRRAVRCGSSARTIPTPTMTASRLDRSRCTSSRDGSVIQRLEPSAPNLDHRVLLRIPRGRYARRCRTTVNQRKFDSSREREGHPTQRRYPGRAAVATPRRRGIVYRVDDECYFPPPRRPLGRSGPGPGRADAGLERDHGRGAASLLAASRSATISACGPPAT